MIYWPPLAGGPISSLGSMYRHPRGPRVDYYYHLLRSATRCSCTTVAIPPSHRDLASWPPFGPLGGTHRLVYSAQRCSRVETQCPANWRYMGVYRKATALAIEIPCARFVLKRGRLMREKHLAPTRRLSRASLRMLWKFALASVLLFFSFSPYLLPLYCYYRAVQYRLLTDSSSSPDSAPHCASERGPPSTLLFPSLPRSAPPLGR
jgi:hypothetical protein